MKVIKVFFIKYSILRTNLILIRYTTIKDTVAERRDTVGNVHVDQAIAILESIIANLRDTVRNVHAGQRLAIHKCAITNLRDTVGNLHAG